MANELLEIKYLDDPAWDVIGGGLSDFNTQQAGDDKGKNLCFVLQTPERRDRRRGDRRDLLGLAVCQPDVGP